MSSPRPTQTDVARRAGVSRALVSLVVRGAPHVREEKRQAVLAAITELGYRPHAAAAHLAARRTNTIGVVVPELRNPFFGELAEGVQKVARRRSMKVLIAIGGHTAQEQQVAAEGFVEGRADALVIVSPRMTDTALQRVGRAMPTCVVGGETRAHDVSWVAADDEQGGRLAARYLLDRGRMHLAHVGPTGTGAEKAARDRVRGFEGEARSGGATVYRIDVHDEASPTRWQQVVAELSASTCDGVATHNDMIALSLLAAHGGAAGGVQARAESGEVWGDARWFEAVVGYDNTAMGALPAISLTSIDQRADDLATLAVEAVCELGPVRQRVAPRVVVRQSG
ncbi:LacI family DNA-binding transcriptional regulator [Devriesea agamarum]|uniref:LacI family DNA-binding transcriptional regulator n=1 Tax=Devriesea agamarum TaxID=472569 RepID=UPI00071D22C3|nr:LacI family DNA-binding transcriptional regulator [Devriesea agamarum]